MKSFFGFLLSLLAVAGLSFGALALDQLRRADLVLPRTVLGDLAIGGFSRQELKALLAERLQALRNQPFEMAARGQVKTVTLKNLGNVLSESTIMAAIPFSGSLSNAELVLGSLAGQRIMPPVHIERMELLRLINETFPDIPKSRNAYFSGSANALKIREAEAGLAPIMPPLLTALAQNIGFFELRPVFVEFETVMPTVFAADLERNRAVLAKKFPRTLILSFEKQKWTVRFDKNPQWIAFSPDLTLQWDSLAFASFLADGVSEKIERAAEDVRIWTDFEGKVQFEGHGNEGRMMEREQLLIMANNAVNNGLEEVSIPIRIIKPKIEVALELQTLGVQELLAVGHTRFEGSPENRKHNIGVGIARFSGLLIPPGETFSFNKNLGPVDDTTGYRKELVIKPEGTIPEFGGGICQVSSTLFRAALFGGFPIVERRPHSYAVSYYAQVGGHGLDATVYPPSPDLKFMNDTPGYILIQSYVDGVDAYFKLYGTADGRSVAMEGPVISNQKPAPAEVLLVHDPKLKPGQKKQVEKAHGGFDALWYRVLAKDGKTTREKIESKYQATMTKFLVGDEVAPKTANGTSTPSVNPFE